jgi:hypothetical protein
MTYVNKLNWGSATEIAKSIGVPTFAKDTAYSFFIFTFWRVNGVFDSALLWDDPLKYMGSDNSFGKTKSEI